MCIEINILFEPFPLYKPLLTHLQNKKNSNTAPNGEFAHNMQFQILTKLYLNQLNISFIILSIWFRVCLLW